MGVGELKGDFKVVFVVVDSTIPLAFVTMVVVVTPADVDWNVISLFDSFSLAILLLTSSVFRRMGTGAGIKFFFRLEEVCYFLDYLGCFHWAWICSEIAGHSQRHPPLQSAHFRPGLCLVEGFPLRLLQVDRFGIVRSFIFIFFIRR